MTNRQTEDIEMIRDPNRWPNWPFLPMKQYTNDSEYIRCRILTPAEEGGYNMYNANLFRLPDNPEELKKTFVKHYALAEAVVLDGWIVD